MNICASISPLEMRLNEAHGNIKRTGGGGQIFRAGIKESSLSALALCSKYFRKIICKCGGFNCHRSIAVSKKESDWLLSIVRNCKY